MSSIQKGLTPIQKMTEDLDKSSRYLIRTWVKPYYPRIDKK